MTITIDATYENGVLKPAQPLPLSEHAQVRVTVEETVAEREPESTELSEPSDEQTLGEWIASLTRDLPPEAFEGLPTDGASQHDHYIYGTPKRTDLRDKPE
jgi:predicted DNA-binding antitoxin AbrB/MazE fold protein